MLTTMNIPRRVITCVVLTVCVLQAFCAHNPPHLIRDTINTPHTSRLVPRFTNTTSTGDPCTDPEFKPPVYEFSNVTISKLIRAENDPSRDNWLATVNFTVHDVANNFVLQCRYLRRNLLTSKDWNPDCIVFNSGENENGNATGRVKETNLTLTLLNIRPEFLLGNKSALDPIRLLQYWYCPIDTNGSYPLVYQSRAEVFLNVTCPDRGKMEVEYPCVVSTVFPVVVKTQWTPAGEALPGTPKLEPHPTTPPPRQGGLDPLPERDCSRLSFMHPEWNVSDGVFLPWRNWSGDYEVGTARVTVTSRVTGNQVHCGFGGPGAVTRESWWVMECDDVMSGQRRDGSVFNVEFYPESRRIKVEERWVCGSVDGLYP